MRAAAELPRTLLAFDSPSVWTRALCSALFVLCASFGQALAATAQSERPRPDASAPDEPALVIDGTPVRAADFAEWLLRAQGEPLARSFVRDHWLVEREARRAGVEVTPAEVSAAVERDVAERIRGAFHGDRSAWLAELARTGRTEAGVLRQRSLEASDRLNARALAAIDRVVPRDKIEREWWLRYGRHGKRYDLSMMKFGVVVESRPEDNRAQWEAENEKQRAARLADARAVRERLVAGADFGQLAQQHSTDPDTRDHRGQPSGGFTDPGWPSSFLDEVEKLAPGDLSQPIYARGGWWLVKVRGLVTTPLAEVEGSLTAELLARGPEDDEVSMVKQRISDGVRVELLPGLLDASPDPELAGHDVPALSIDGEPVSRGAYGRWLMNTLGETFARNYVEEWLLRRKASALGIDVSEAEVQQRSLQWVADIIDTDYGRSRQRWYESLARTGRTEQDFLRDIAHRLRSDLIAEKLILRERKVTEDEIRLRYVNSYGDTGVRKQVARILVSSRYEQLDHQLEQAELGRAHAEAFERARVLALSIVERARGGADFAELARKESDDLRTREAGGVLPGRFRPDTVTAPVAAAVDALKEGEVTDPLPVGVVWAIYKMLSVRKVEYQDVHAEIEAELLTEPPKLFEVRVYRNTLAQQSKYTLGAGMAR